MKVLFLTSNPDDNIGSYRIWVRDLCRTLEDLGHQSKISHIQGNFDCTDYDVVILGKSCYNFAPQIKKLYKDSKIGSINVASDHYDSNIDFIIAGSPEEYISLSSYKNVFIYPLIERKFENVAVKDHKPQDLIRFCFHGHWPHLAKFHPSVSKAIEEYKDKVGPCELHLIIGEDSCKVHENLLPKNVDIFYHNYKKIDFSKVMMKMDIGLVPNVTNIENFVKGISNVQSTELGLYKTDFNVRFKNKTNAGRSYVFYQHGIPVIHDLSPSSFDFMGRTGEYICGHDYRSYLREMIKLSDHKARNRVAQNNRNTFNRDFNPLDHGKKLVNFIKEEVLDE